MPKTKTDTAEFLKGLGLDPDAPALGKAAPPPVASEMTLAPEGVDPHTMAVTDIVFDPHLLDEFTDLGFTNGGQGALAQRKVFDLYKSYGRNKDRNRLLHDRIGTFIRQVDRSRRGGDEPTTAVKDKVRSTKKQRDLVAYLEERGITSLDDLTAALGK